MLVTKKLKKCKPYRVVNPVFGGGHHAHLHVGQSLDVCLDSPSNFASSFDEDPKELNWSLSINSPFFYIAETKEIKGRVWYHLNQKYDLTDLTFASSLHLGSIDVFLRHKSGRICRHTTICAIIEARAPGKDAVLTVVNPKEQRVRMEGFQLLEVVLYEDSLSSGTSWTDEIKLLDSASVCLEKIRCEQIGLGDYAVKIGHDNLFYCESKFLSRLPVNPFIPDSNKKAVLSEQQQSLAKIRECPSDEVHYWYRFNQDEQNKLANQPNGSSEICEINFIGCPDVNKRMTSFSKRDLKVELVVKAKNKRRMQNDERDLLKYEANTVGLTSHYFDSDSKVITYPRNEHKISFKNLEDVLLVNVPLIEGNESGVSTRWECKVPKIESFDFPGVIEKLKVREINDHLINGKVVQRFLISPTIETTKNENQLFLGHVEISCPPIGNLTKVLSVYFSKNTEAKKTEILHLPTVAETKKYGVKLPSSQSSGYSGASSYFKKPLVASVEFSVLNCKALEELVDKSYVLDEVEKKTKLCGSGYSWENKKKEDSRGSGSAGSRGNGNGFSWSTETKTNEKEERERNLDTIVRFNPSQGDYVTLRRRPSGKLQKLVVRIAPPEVLFGPEYAREIWSANLMQVSKHAMRVGQQKTILVDNKYVYEMHLDIIEERLAKLGLTKPIGWIKFSVGEAGTTSYKQLSLKILVEHPPVEALLVGDRTLEAELITKGLRRIAYPPAGLHHIMIEDGDRLEVLLPYLPSMYVTDGSMGNWVVSPETEDIKVLSSSQTRIEDDDRSEKDDEDYVQRVVLAFNPKPNFPCVGKVELRTGSKPPVTLCIWRKTEGVDNVRKCRIREVEHTYRCQKTGTSQKNLYVYEWQHNQAVVLDPNNCLNVEIPYLDEHPNLVWDVKLVNYQIPAEVWRHLPQHVKDKLSQDDAWLKEDGVVGKTSDKKTYQLKSLEEQQPLIYQILDVLGNKLPLEFGSSLLIGEIVFTAELPSMKVEEDHQETETIQKITRRLKVQVTERSLGEHVENNSDLDVDLDDPKDGTDFVVFSNKEFSLRLRNKSVFQGVNWKSLKWTCILAPDFVKYEKQLSADGYQVFRFKTCEVSERKVSWLTFVCDSLEKKIKVTVVPECRSLR